MKLAAVVTATLLSCSLLSAQEGDVIIEKGISYLPADRAEKADLYKPKDDGKLHPAVLIVHGGGWAGGSRNSVREINIGTTLAAKGYVCLSIDYMLGKRNETNHCFPQNIHDCKTAVRWLRANAERLKIDPTRIGAIGGSAGGHLVAMLGATQPADGLDPTEPYGDQSCAINCVVDLYGPVDTENWHDISALRKKQSEDPALYKKFSVLTYLDPKDPPVLIIHGTADKTVDHQQSVNFAAVLKKLGIEHELITVEGGIHSFHLQPPQMDLRPAVVAFFDKHLKVTR